METRPKQKTWTIKNILEWTADHFRNRGISTARLDAEVLLANALHADRLFLYLNLERPLSAEERHIFREYVRRRSTREPVSLIIGRKEFWSIPLRVQRGVLIPRPDTETLVEAVGTALRGIPDAQALEIGTGSGAVSIALAKEHPNVRIFATDINLQALNLAKSNATECGVNIEFFACDLFSAMRQGQTFHVIFSNPPYVKSSIIPTLDPEINFEPINALDGGSDGLDVIRKMVPAANALLRRGGELIIEMEADQENEVGKIFSDAGFSDVSVYRDLAGRPRVMRGKAA